MNQRHVALLRLFAFLLFALALNGCRKQDFPQYPANYREYAYVTNGDSGTVSIYDVVNVRLDRELAVGQHPVAVLASPTRNEVYVVNSGAENGLGSVSVIDATNNSVAATIAVHRQPVSIDLAADGTLAYVTNSGSNSISVIDLKARREVAQVSAGDEPVQARVTPDGKTLVVANRHGGSVSIFDAAQLKLRQSIAGCPGAADVVILPDSSKAFAACSTGHQLLAIALARPETHPGQLDRLEAVLDVGHDPVHLALKPDGGELFASNALSDSISEVSTTTDEVGGAYTVGSNPVRGLVSRDNALLYEANFHSQWVTVYGIDDGKLLNPGIHVGDGPAALAFSTGGHLLFVVDTRSSDVAVVRTASRSLFTFLPAGRGPNAIAVKSFTRQ